MLIYQVLIFVTALVAILRGFKLGLARQIPSIVGMAFGIICCRIYMPPVANFIYQLAPGMHPGVEHDAYYSVASCTLIFLVVYSLFRFLTSFTGKVIAERVFSVVDNIGGAIFSLFQYMLVLSLALNFILASNPHGSLLRAGKSDDGNAVELVMLMGSATLGYESVEDLAHKVQIEEASRIS